MKVKLGKMKKFKGGFQKYCLNKNKYNEKIIEAKYNSVGFDNVCFEDFHEEPLNLYSVFSPSRILPCYLCEYQIIEQPIQ